MSFQKKVFHFLLLIFFGVQIHGQRSMYVLCPPKFIPLGNECYFISQDRVSWLDAHFECKERNSRLAEPTRKEDRFLRKYLNNLNGLQLNDMWIGARYNWERNKWQWGYNGEDLTYQSFSQMSADNKDLKFHCAILKSKLKYRWSASSCVQQLQYVCQHKMKIVNEKKRQDIYSKWNETYPNEKANEILKVVSKNDLIRLRGEKFGQRKKVRKTSHAYNGDNHLENFVYQNHMRNSRRGLNKQFDLNRYRAQGIRHTIHFNSTKQSNRNNRQWRQKQRLNTHLTSYKTNYSSQATTISVSTPHMNTITTPSTLRPAERPAIWTSDIHTNDVNRNSDQYAENERTRQHQNTMNKTMYKNEQNEDATIQQNKTNKIETLENVATTTMSSREMKKRKLNDLRKSLSKLTQEQQIEFFKRRAERNKKRGISVVNTI